MIRKNMPLYRSVYNDIFEKIRSGYYHSGELIPTEEELQKSYNVSRVTIRKATDLLAKDNLLVRTAGFGTIVQAKFLSSKTVDLLGFNDEMIAQGKTPSTKVLEFGITKTNAKIASILGIAEDETVYHLKRLRLGDNEPLQFEETYMSTYLYPNLSLSHLETGKFSFVESCGYTIDIAYHQTIPILPTKEIAELFGIDSLTPIIKVNNTTLLTDGRVMDYTEQYINSPKYQLQYTRKK